MKKATAHLNQQQLDHRADALNANPGSAGTNPTNGHVHGNRSHQLEQSRARAVKDASRAKPGGK